MGIQSNFIPYRPAIHYNAKTEGGCVGDGVTDDTTAINNSSVNAKAAGKILYFPAGTYMATSAKMTQCQVVGENPTTTSIVNISGTYVGANAIETHGLCNIKLVDFKPGSPYLIPPPSLVFENCHFFLTSGTTNGATYFYYGYQSGQKFREVTFKNCYFDLPKVYVCIWTEGIENVNILNCEFPNREEDSGTTHVIRISHGHNNYMRSVRVIGNKITRRNVTGIFHGSQRDCVVENVVIEGNEIHNTSEETISFDGFGDNVYLSPIICNGYISSVTNDSNGRIVIGFDNMRHTTDGSTQISCPISNRTDWEKYRFIFMDGTNLKGMIAEIYSYDPDDNTMTLNMQMNANNIALGIAAISAGFFNCIVRNNRCIGTDDNGAHTSHGVSLWLNVFNILVENNFVSGHESGIQLSGGLMLSTYYNLAYHCTIRNNTFMGCTTQSAKITSEYFGMKQIGNKFIGNTCIGGGPIYVSGQEDFLFEDNIIDCDVIFTYNNEINVLD